MTHFTPTQKQKQLIMKVTLVIYMFFFYKYIKIQGLRSDMLKATQNIGWKYSYDMLILYVRIFKMGAIGVGLSHMTYIVIHKL